MTARQPKPKTSRPRTKRAKDSGKNFLTESESFEYPQPHDQPQSNKHQPML